MNATPEGCVLEVGKANFDAEVLRSQRPVLVVFWAPLEPGLPSGRTCSKRGYDGRYRGA